jgi:hypothetical protein
MFAYIVPPHFNGLSFDAAGGVWVLYSLGVGGLTFDILHHRMKEA